MRLAHAALGVSRGDANEGIAFVWRMDLEFAEAIAGLLAVGLVFWLALVWIALVPIVLLTPLLIPLLYVMWVYVNLYITLLFPGLMRGGYWS